MCVSARVCVRERVGERKGEGKSESEKERERKKSVRVEQRGEAHLDRECVSDSECVGIRESKIMCNRAKDRER